MSSSRIPKNDCPIHRVAINFANAQTDPWHDAARRWLGRCALTQERLPQPVIADISAAEQRRLTAAPRRLGWHASLRAPFAPVEGAGLQEIRRHLKLLCKGFTPFQLPKMKLVVLDGCLAFAPEDRCIALNLIADSIVLGMHPLARALSSDDIQRRRSAGLSAQQDSLLLRWGSPHVMEQFRFAFFLTGSLGGLDSVSIKRLISAAQMHFSGLPVMRFDRVAIFVEPEPSSDFQWMDSIEFGARELLVDA